MYVCDENIHNAVKNEMMQVINKKKTLKYIILFLFFIGITFLSFYKHMFFMPIINEHVFVVNTILNLSEFYEYDLYNGKNV